MVLAARTESVGTLFKQSSRLRMKNIEMKRLLINFPIFPSNQDQ
jgi:hypothetical protein